jgi:oligopeptide transport system substrate-binding protein
MPAQLRRIFPYSVVPVLLGLLAFGFSSGCSRRETPVEAGIRTQTLHIGNGWEPRDLDPHIINNVADFNIVFALMEGLTSSDPKDGHPVPGVAERWEPAPDGLTWTFHLRKDARWSNGDPVTAGDFLYGFRRVLSPALGAEYATFLFFLANADEFNAGTLKDFSQVGCRAIDASTLELKLKVPTPYLPSLTSMPAWFPAHQPTIEKFGAIDARATAWTRAGNYVGNGPFVMKEWRQNQFIRVERSETYWDRPAVKLRAADFYPMEATPEEAAFRAGQLHVTTPYLSPSRLDAYRREPAKAAMLHESAGLTSSHLWLNTKKPPLDDVRVRRALSLAIDRAELCRAVMHCDLPSRSLTPPGCAGYPITTNLPTDVVEAKRLLAESGYPDGRGFPKLELLYAIGLDSVKSTAEALQEIWRRQLGIEVAVVQSEGKVFQDTVQHRQHQIGLYGWIGDYLDPTTFLDILESKNGNNMSGWSNPTYDELLRKAARIPTQAERYAVLSEAEALILADVPMIPLFYGPQRELRSPAVRRWEDNVLGRHPLKFVSLESGKK